MFGAFFYIVGFALPWVIIFLIASSISKSKWVDKNFPQLANKLSDVLNLEITNKEALIGITIGPENGNHIILGKNKAYLSVKYIYNCKRFSHDIKEWEYGKDILIDDIILSIKTNIENTEPLQNQNLE